jgi:hypothetical protein
LARKGLLPRRRDDETGQMMILAAVLLVIGLIALAGMVARVNQLGTQTGVEADKAILDEVTPIQDALDAGIGDLRGGRSFTACWGLTTATTQVTTTTAQFSQQDEGRHVTGTNIPAQTYILDYRSPTLVILSAATTSPGAQGSCSSGYGEGTLAVDQFTGIATASAIGCTVCTSTVTASSGFFLTSPSLLESPDIGKRVTGAGLPEGATVSAVTSSTVATLNCPTACTAVASSTMSIGRFALTPTTAPTLERAVVGMLEQLQRIETSHGIWMDYQLTCVAADPARGQVIVHLSDGTVWVEVRSSVTFTRDGGTCATVTG